MNPQGLKALIISADQSALTPGSAASLQLLQYGALVDELHVVVLSLATRSIMPQQIAKNVWVYATNSAIGLLQPFDAARIGKKIVLDRKFVRGRSVISAENPFGCGWAGLSIKRKWRLPLEVEVHGDLFSSQAVRQLGPVRRRVAHTVLSGADTARVESAEAASGLAGYFPGLQGSISILPDFIDVSVLEASHPAFDVHARFGFKFAILSVARLVPEKRLDLLVKAVARLRTYYPEVGLIIVGDGPERGTLEALAKESGISHAVVFTGWETDIATYYRTADVFVQTSGYEGYGKALVEAGIVGLPVVTTPVGIAREFTDGQELIVCPPGDGEFLFKTLYDLVGNNALRQLLSARLKQALLKKLISKEAYGEKMRENWEKTASRIHS